MPLVPSSFLFLVVMPLLLVGGAMGFSWANKQCTAAAVAVYCGHFVGALGLIEVNSVLLG